MTLTTTEKRIADRLCIQRNNIKKIRILTAKMVSVTFINNEIKTLSVYGKI